MQILLRFLVLLRRLVFKATPKTTGKKVAVGTGVVGTITAIVTLVTPLVQEHEGLRNIAYLDPVGIPTICFGETRNVELGQALSTEECVEMLEPRLVGFLEEMRTCTHVTLPAKTETAFLSFTYNLGSGVYCRNIAGKRINVGNLVGACEALLLYTKAGGREFRGLVRRRADEHRLCMSGLREAGLL